jgi:uncharacterized membrane protein
MQVGRMIANAVHGILLSFPIALFTAALVTDIAYLNTAVIQWTNFSSWLIAGAMVFGGAILVWSLVTLGLHFRKPSRNRHILYAGVLALMCLFGLINAFKHSQDAWASVGAFGLILSILCTLLAMAAAVIAWSGFMNQEVAR